MADASAGEYARGLARLGRPAYKRMNVPCSHDFLKAEPFFVERRSWRAERQTNGKERGEAYRSCGIV